MTPNTGPFDIDVTSDAVSALFEKIGLGILSPTRKVAVLVGPLQSKIPMFGLSSPLNRGATSCSRKAKSLRR